MLTLLLRYRYDNVFISVTFSSYLDVNYSKFCIIYSSSGYLLKKSIIFYLEISLVLGNIRSIDMATNWPTQTL